MLGKEGVQLDLVYRGDDCPLLAELLQIWDRPVSDADGLDLAGFVNFLHLTPCLALIPRSVDRPCAIRVDGENLARLILSAQLIEISFGELKIGRYLTYWN